MNMHSVPIHAMILYILHPGFFHVDSKKKHHESVKGVAFSKPLDSCGISIIYVLNMLNSKRVEFVEFPDGFGGCQLCFSSGRDLYYNSCRIHR